jgi:hypothetical protein
VKRALLSLLGFALVACSTAEASPLQRSTWLQRASSAAGESAPPGPLEIFTSDEIEAYWHADIGVTAGGDDRVTTWLDQTSNDNDLTGVSGQGPTVEACDDGHTCLRAVADARLMRASNNFVGFGIGTHPHVYVLGEFTGDDDDFGCWFEAGPAGEGSPGDGFAAYASGDGSMNFRSLLGDEPFPDEATWGGFDPPDSAAHLYEFRVPTRSETYFDGSKVSSDGFFPDSAGLQLASDNISLFDSLGTELIGADVYFVLMLDEAPSAGELSALYAWIEYEYPSVSLP